MLCTRFHGDMGPSHRDQAFLSCGEGWASRISQGPQAKGKGLTWSAHHVLFSVSTGGGWDLASCVTFLPSGLLPCDRGV